MKKKISLLIRDEGGAIAVMTVIMMVAFVGILAVVIDLGHLHTVQNELRNAADAAALAGARRLMPMTAPVGGPAEPPWPMEIPPPCEDAKQTAIDTAYLNKAAGAAQKKNITLVPGEVLTGNWDFIPVGTYTGTFTPTACGSTTNAVQVTARMRGDLSQGSVIMTFAKIFGIDTVDPSATAVAVIGNLTTLGAGPNRGFIAPNENFMREIYERTYNPDGTPKLGGDPDDKNWYLVLQPARGNLDWTNADNAGWSLPEGYPGGDNPTPATLNPVIQNGMNDTMTIGDMVNLNNGIPGNAVLNVLADAIAAAKLAGSDGLKITVPVVDSVDFNHPEQIIDFYTIELTEVWKAGEKKDLPQNLIDGTGIQDQTKFVGVIQFRILKKEAITGEPGPATNNTVAMSPKIVR